MKKSDIIRDGLKSLGTAQQFKLDADGSSQSSKVMILREAARLGIKVKTWNDKGATLVIRVE